MAFNRSIVSAEIHMLGQPVSSPLIQVQYLMATSLNCWLPANAKWLLAALLQLKLLVFALASSTPTRPVKPCRRNTLPLLVKVAVVSSGTTIAPLGRAAVGQNTSVILNSGNTTTGNSAQAIDDTTDITATLPIRIIDVVPETATGADAFVEMIVKINTHTYNNTTGI
jgi:hypothetical protein